MLAVRVATCLAELVNLIDNARVIVFGVLFNAFDKVHMHSASIDLVGAGRHLLALRKNALNRGAHGVRRCECSCSTSRPSCLLKESAFRCRDKGRALPASECTPANKTRTNFYLIP